MVKTPSKKEQKKKQKEKGKEIIRKALEKGFKSGGIIGDISGGVPAEVTVKPVRRGGAGRIIVPIKAETPEQRALILAAAQQEVKATAKFEALRARRLAEEKQRIQKKRIARAELGKVIVEGEVAPFAPRREVSEFERRADLPFGRVQRRTITQAEEMEEPPPKIFGGVEVTPAERPATERRGFVSAFFGELGTERTRQQIGLAGEEIVRPVAEAGEELLSLPPEKVDVRKPETVLKAGAASLKGAIELVVKKDALPKTRQILATATTVVVAANVAPIVLTPKVIIPGVQVGRLLAGETTTVESLGRTALQVTAFQAIGKGIKFAKEVRFESKVALRPEQIGKPFKVEKIFKIDKSQFLGREVTKFKGIGKKQTFVQLRKVEGGFLVVEKRTGAVTGLRQRQLIPKDIDVLAQFKQPSLGLKRPSTELQFKFKSDLLKLPKQKPTFTARTETGKLIPGDRPSTQVRLTQFKEFGLKFEKTSKLKIGFQPKLEFKQVAPKKQPFLGKFLKSKKAQISVTRFKTQFDTGKLGTGKFDTFDSGRSKIKLPDVKVGTGIRKSVISRPKTGISFIIPPVILHTDRGKIKAIPEIMTGRGFRDISISTPAVRVTPKVGIVPKAAQRVTPRAGLAPALAKPTTRPDIFRPSPITTGPDIFKPRPTPTPGITPTPFFPGLGERGFFPRRRRKKKKERVFLPTGRAFRFAPSLEAIIFNIKGPSPTLITGLELRPIKLKI